MIGSRFADLASRTAFPKRHAWLIVLWIEHSRMSRPRIGPNANIDAHPMATVTERASFSNQSIEVASWNTTTLPLSSASTAGKRASPHIASDDIWTSGKARPMPSASTTGRSSSAATIMCSTALAPPISSVMSAATGRPATFSSARTAMAPSLPRAGFSIHTVGAPKALNGTTRSSSSSASGAMTRIRRPRSSCSRARRNPRCTLPPPPVPRIPAPIAMAERSSASMVQAVIVSDLRSPWRACAPPLRVHRPARSRLLRRFRPYR